MIIVAIVLAVLAALALAGLVLLALRYRIPVTTRQEAETLAEEAIARQRREVAGALWRPGSNTRSRWSGLGRSSSSGPRGYEHQAGVAAQKGPTARLSCRYRRTLTL